MKVSHKVLLAGTIVCLAVGAILYTAGALPWLFNSRRELPAGIASANGRIEAVEIHIATKTAGRLRELLVNEGEFVNAGDVLARMDTSVVLAQMREAKAQLRQSQSAVAVANSQVTQRESEKAAAEAIVAQREAELDVAKKRLARTESLEKQSATSQQQLDDDRTSFHRANAALNAAKAQVAAGEAGILTAKSQVIGAEAAVEALQATIERIQADIDDSELKAPRDGRVQYRVAEPGEVLNPGGVVLNLLDVGDVYMTFFLSTAEAGRVAIGSEARLVLDAAPQYVIPAKVSFVADVAQFTPRTVETAEERQKLMFRVKVKIGPELLQQYIRSVKTGLPGMAHVRLDEKASWPVWLQIRLPAP
jgi:HlyD family secretion protein